MRRRPILLCPLAVAALVVVGLGGAAHAATPVQYVALGDSYSSGVGAGSYLASSGSCDRSPNAFPALYAAATQPASYTSVACGGATTATVNSTQISALSASTTLASITIGGNDVGFSSIVTTCVEGSTATCVAAVNAAETYARGTLPGLLDGTYGRIRAAAPNATVVALDYPAFYDLGPWLCLGLSSTDHAKIDEGINLLDGVVASAAGRAGFAFADVRSAFGGHQICDGGSKWLHALKVSDISESYHPTAAGQSGAYEPVFARAVG